MKVEVTDAGSWRKTLEIEVPPEEMKKRLADAYKSYSKSLNLPGFRKGRVPVSVVKGLELDGVVVVEPQRIVTDTEHGMRSLYVALTRSTQRLSVVHAGDLPTPLR